MIYHMTPSSWWVCDYILLYTLCIGFLITGCVPPNIVVTSCVAWSAIILMLHLLMRVSIVCTPYNVWRDYRQRARDRSSAATKEIIQRMRRIYREEMITDD